MVMQPGGHPAGRSAVVGGWTERVLFGCVAHFCRMKVSEGLMGDWGVWILRCPFSVLPSREGAADRCQLCMGPGVRLGVTRAPRFISGARNAAGGPIAEVTHPIGQFKQLLFSESKY